MGDEGYASLITFIDDFFFKNFCLVRIILDEGLLFLSNSAFCLILRLNLLDVFALISLTGSEIFSISFCCSSSCLFGGFVLILTSFLS
jgi:hypothetical protein